MAVFVKKNKEKDYTDLNIATMQGRRVKRGHVGIEIECETATAGSLPRQGVIAEYWEYERDGSLRGADNGEYILTKPINFDKVDDAVNKLWEAFKEKKVKLSESIRTSVHVHLNVLPFFQNRLAAFLGLWFIFEETLSYWCGDHRAGNLFCIRAKDGEAIIRQIKGWLEAKGKFKLNNEALHYSALNMAALNKYGSIEIRTMRGTTTPEPVKQWVRILKKLYDASERFEDPRTLIEKFSLAGPFDFFVDIFGEEAEGILKNVGELNVRDSLFEGMRFAQDVIYARDWSDFNPVKKAVDPFLRKSEEEEEPVEEDRGLRLGRALDEFVRAEPPRAANARQMPRDWVQNQIDALAAFNTPTVVTARGT